MPISGEILKGKAEELASGLALVAGSYDGRSGIISNTKLYQVKMQQLIKTFVVIGRNPR